MPVFTIAAIVAIFAAFAAALAWAQFHARPTDSLPPARACSVQSGALFKASPGTRSRN